MAKSDVASTKTKPSISLQTTEWARANGLLAWFEAETSSTNTVAKNLTAAILENSKPSKSPLSDLPLILFATDSQTAGRGRGENSWSTPSGALLSTWSFALPFAPQPILSPLVGLALFEAARAAFPDVAFYLKAPNDLYVGDKKIAGLLIENVIGSASERVICAIGLGFNASEAPAELETATGLASHVSADLIRSAWPKFLAKWVEGLQASLSSARQSELSAREQKRLLDALNRNPKMKEPVQNVGPLGQIQFASRTLNWSDL